MSGRIMIPLDIPDIQLLGVEVTAKGDYLITVESTLEKATCRKCGREITQFHGYDEWITLRHLPILGHKVYLRLRPKRYQCPYCSGMPTSTQRLAWYEPRSPHTKAYEHSLLIQLIHSTIQDISWKEELGYDAVEGVVERYLRTEVNWKEFERIGVLGLDEIALKKGHRDFVVLATVREEDGTIHVVAVLPDRKKTTVRRFLRTIPKPLQRTIHTVCTDMYDGYINAVKQELKAAVVVIDRYHVAQKYRACADALRKKELKRLKKELPKEAYEEVKGAMWAFRKNKADVQPEEADKLNRLFGYAPDLKQGYDFREELTEIFNQNLSKVEATEKIQQWRERVQASGLTCFDSFLKTLDKRMEEITNYFLHRHTSSFVEGLNNKIKVLKRRCYGIFNLKHLFQRIFLDLEGYRLFAKMAV